MNLLKSIFKPKRLPDVFNHWNYTVIYFDKETNIYEAYHKEVEFPKPVCRFLVESWVRYYYNQRSDIVVKDIQAYHWPKDLTFNVHGRELGFKDLFE